MRHGESKANTAHIILSHPNNGTKGFGLTKKGKSQVEDAIQKNKILDSKTLVYCSDFIRAKETAKIIKKYIGSKKINYVRSLRERSFGKWEKTSNTNYEKVWQEDLKNPHHTIGEVESTSEVTHRVTKLISHLEKKFKNKYILLVAHGDTLQILQTSFQKVPSSYHRKLKHLELAEIRELKLKK